MSEMEANTPGGMVNVLVLNGTHALTAKRIVNAVAVRAKEKEEGADANAWLYVCERAGGGGRGGEGGALRRRSC